MKKIILFGATSAIAQAMARIVVEKEKSEFCLIGRNAARLESIAADLRTRGSTNVACVAAEDWSDAGISNTLELAKRSLSGYDAVWLFHAVLGEAPAHDRDWTSVRDLFELNTMSYLRVMHQAALDFEAQQHGTLLVCSSVAADRGRVKNTWYAATKAPLELVAEAFRQRFVSLPAVKILTLKPGLIDTPMTQKLEKGLLASTPEVVAATFYRSYKRGFEVIYAPWYWTLIMIVISFIPRVIFKRLKF